MRTWEKTGCLDTQIRLQFDPDMKRAGGACGHMRRLPVSAHGGRLYTGRPWCFYVRWLE